MSKLPPESKEVPQGLETAPPVSSGTEIPKSGSQESEALTEIPKRGATSNRRIVAGVVAAIGLIASVLGILAWVNIDPFDRTGPLSGSPPVPATGIRGAAHCPKLLDGRVNRANDVTLLVDVASESEPCWTQRLSPVAPGTVLKYLITYQNPSRYEEDNVYVRVNLPPGYLFVPNSTRLFNQSNPHGILLTTNDLPKGGVVIGNYNPLAASYVEFSAALPAKSDSACTWTEFRLVAAAGGRRATSRVASIALDEYYNTVIVNMFRAC